MSYIYFPRVTGIIKAGSRIKNELCSKWWYVVGEEIGCYCSRSTLSLKLLPLPVAVRQSPHWHQIYNNHDSGSTPRSFVMSNPYPVATERSVFDAFSSCTSTSAATKTRHNHISQLERKRGGIESRTRCRCQYSSNSTSSLRNKSCFQHENKIQKF